MKHLSLKCKLSPDQKSAILSIVEQTHTYNSFGNCSVNNIACYFKYGRIVLYSHGYISMTCMSPKDTNGTDWWIVLKAEGGHIEGRISIPAELWPEIKDAVAAYNEWGKTQ